MSDTKSNTYEIPSTMKVAQQNSYGEVRDVLTLRDDIPVPQQLSSNQILVRVYAAAMNPIDYKLLNGNFSLVVRHSFPHVPGGDAAGVVVAIGADVKRFKVGDEVYGNLGFGGGSFAEYARANESVFALKPKNLNMIEAAAVPMTGETSYQALFNQISPPVGKGSKLFVCGGSSSAGSYAIQLAKAVGAQVATTASQRNFNLLQKLGFSVTQDKEEFNNDPEKVLIIDYNSKDFGDELQGTNFDAVFDCVGGIEQWIAAQKILKPSGQFVTILGDDTKLNVSVKSIVTIGSTIAFRKLRSYFTSGHHNYTFHALKQNPQDLDDLRVNYIETGKVKPIIDSVYDVQKDGIEAFYSAFEKSKSGKAQGKLVLKFIDE